MVSLKLAKIGNSTGIILPKETLARMKLKAGDTVFVTETPDGVQLTPYDAAFDRQMEAARRIMKKRRAALRALAK